MCGPKYNYKLASVIMGLLCVFMGTQMVQTGHEHFGPSFHAYRKWLAPQIPNKLAEGITFDDLAKMIVQLHGALMCLAGVLIMFGNRFVGPLIMIYQM